MTYIVAQTVDDYIGEHTSMHSLVTLGLLALQSWPAVEPLLKKVMVKLTVAMYGLSMASAKATVVKVRAVLSSDFNYGYTQN